LGHSESLQGSIRRSQLLSIDVVGAFLLPLQGLSVLIEHELHQVGVLIADSAEASIDELQRGEDLQEAGAKG